MSTRYVSLGLVALLVSCALGAPHDEDAPQTLTGTDQPPPTGRSTTTVLVTLTTTSYTTEESPHNASSSTSGFDIPLTAGSVTLPSNKPDDSSPTGTAATVTCSHPTDSCIINGIPIWPSGTTSLVLPSFTFDPLPTSMDSGLVPSASGTMMTETLATSGSPTDSKGHSITCPHTMLHVVPGDPSSDPPWVPKLPYITHSRSMDAPSGGSTDDPSSSATSGNPTESLPISTISNPSDSNSMVPTYAVHGSGLSEFNWPTRSAIISDSSATSSVASTSAESTASIPQPQAPDAEAPVRARDTEINMSNISTTHSSTLSWKTKYIDASAFRGMDNAIPSARTLRDEESKASKRRMNYWTRFFAVAEPLVGRVAERCLACDQDGEITCLPGRKYTWCTDGCAVMLNLGCDMVCKQGFIRKDGQYCVS